MMLPDRDGAADRVRAGGIADDDAIDFVPQAGGAGGVRADVIALDDVAGRTRPVKLDSPVVRRDQVAARGLSAANRVIDCALDQHALVLVAQVRESCLVRSYEIAFQQVPGGLSTVELDADLVTRDDLGAGGIPLDRVV